MHRVFESSRCVSRTKYISLARRLAWCIWWAVYPAAIRKETETVEPKTARARRGKLSYVTQELGSTQLLGHPVNNWVSVPNIGPWHICFAYSFMKVDPSSKKVEMTCSVHLLFICHYQLKRQLVDISSYTFLTHGVSERSNYYQFRLAQTVRDRQQQLVRRCM